LNRYISRPNEKKLDRILLKQLRENPDEMIHIDVLAGIARDNWPEWYDSNPKDNRHYVRTRLQSLKDTEGTDGQGRIGNPKYRYYCYPKTKNSPTHLDWEELWDDFLNNAKKAKESGKIFVGYNAKHTVEISELTTKKGEPNIVLRGDVGEVNNDFTESNFREAIIRLNTVGGRMHRPRRSLGKNIILVGLLERLEFDDEDYVIVTEKEFDPKLEYDDLDSNDKVKVIDVIKSLKTPKTKGKRTVSNLVREARQRSKGKSELRESRKRKFDLDKEWINEKSKITHCEITGIKFTTNFESGPFARSLDCRDPNLDYTKENVDVVVSIYNLAKNKWPPEVVKEFCIEWHKNIDQ